MAGIHALNIDKNSDYAVVFSFFEDDGITPLNFNGYSADFIARERNSLSSKILFIPDELLINNNQVTLKILASTTKNISTEIGYFNLILKRDLHKTRMIEGEIYLTRSIDDN